MLIKARMGMSVDGFVAIPEGVPTLALIAWLHPGGVARISRVHHGR
jgi:hypothetical protein